MKAPATRNKSKVTAFCCLLLAVLAVVWAASAGGEKEENPGDYTVFGNSFARLTSDSVEVFSRSGDLMYTVPFTGSGSVLTASGETAALWSPGGGLLFLGEGGYRSAAVNGELLGVFGSECGAVCAICETGRSQFAVSVYSAAGEAFSLTAEGFFPLAAAVSPDGGELALLCADETGYFVRTYSLRSGAAQADTRLDGTAYSLTWDSSGLRAAYTDGEAIIKGG